MDVFCVNNRFMRSQESAFFSSSNQMTFLTRLNVHWDGEVYNNHWKI